jgi:acyl carrier protein
MITINQFHNDLESMLELDPGTITGDKSLDEIAWDSMTVVMFIAMADQNYSAAVSPSKLADAKTVADLYTLVTNPS